jgi:uncharacterized protein (DUF58 family)
MITARPAVVLAVGGLTVAVLGLVSAGGSVWLVALAFLGLAVGLSLLDLAVAAPLSQVTLERAGEKAVWLGESTTVSLTVHNGSPRPLRAYVRDAWVPSAGAVPYRHDVSVDAGGSTTVDTTLTPVRRGDRAAVRVTVRSYGPFRFAYRQSRASVSHRRTPQWTLRVYPRFEARRLLPEKLARLRVFDGAVATRGRGQGTEFDTLREYVIGDDVRSIDWRASARAHDVVVRTWRPERDRRVLCLLDTGRTSAARIGDEPRLDAAIDAALLLSVLATRAEDRVDLLAVDTAIRARVQGSHRSKLTRLINAMAALEPALVETDFSLAVAELLRRDHRRALVVIFTALDAAPIIEGLLPMLSRLTTRHRVVVASVRDPETARLAVLPATGATADDVHVAAAAELALAERERVRAVLTQLGVIVVDEPRDLFASRVTDAYLSLKAAGRL